jgi:hypothetical protein
VSTILTALQLMRAKGLCSHELDVAERQVGAIVRLGTISWTCHELAGARSNSRRNVSRLPTWSHVRSRPWIHCSVNVGSA